MATRKKSTGTDVVTSDWPKITEGSHLTVYTFEDGSTQLKWDDEALTRDVVNAIMKYESTIPVANDKPKKTKGKKNVSTQ